MINILIVYVILWYLNRMLLGKINVMIVFLYFLTCLRHCSSDPHNIILTFHAQRKLRINLLLKLLVILLLNAWHVIHFKQVWMLGMDVKVWFGDRERGTLGADNCIVVSILIMLRVDGVSSYLSDHFSWRCSSTSMNICKVVPIVKFIRVFQYIIVIVHFKLFRICWRILTHAAASHFNLSISIIWIL